ncbi:PKD domain-containing protein [Bizionia argentinensis JUB59]|uniref:PKD domain-containing protein n=1 Tax=Bizionia argentinensis JUB59 TaxID=1046627 RepID=G2ECR8_9FLAO|nr:PKD domain-containing protein [Bizionia argentinensis]EGV43766.1 PKD domain-containing protein [Bizionia argentinensis JUB59]
MRNCFTFLIFSCCFQWLSAQETPSQDSIPRIATIKHHISGNAIQLTPETPILEQIAGAPKAFYSYYWEFDDGTYSKDENPKHIYKKPGDYEVKLWATNHYDTGKPPSTRPKKITVSKTDNSDQEQASMTEDFLLERNREPMPEENMVVILRYKNYLNHTTNGKLYLFYNERKYKADNFTIEDTRTYHNEQHLSTPDFAATNIIDDSDRTFLAYAENGLMSLKAKPQDSTIKVNLPLTLEESKAYYKNYEQFDFNNMAPNEERNMFFTLKTPPEMLKDTSAIIAIRGVYVPDANYDNHKVKDMEMEIVTSHDPNNMASNGTVMNYRLVRFKTLKYKIKFQNNGEGPANTIRLETDIPEMLDKSTIEVTDMYPKCKICPKDREVRYSCLDTTFTDTQAIFTFKNIYLPGSEQKNVKEYDSTKGFVKYNIKFGKDFHKQKTKSQTAIIFDKNDPIITNYSTTRFTPGISIGAKAGYNAFSDLKNSESYFVGATISPYKSYRWYWQVELLNSFHKFSSAANTTEQLRDDTQGTEYLQRTTTKSNFQNVDWEIPVLLRYNINNYIGIGAGLQGMLSISERETKDKLIERFEVIGANVLLDSSSSSIENSNTFTNFRAGLLLDITAGFVRIGPSVGARYVLNFQDDFNYWQLYAIWKF